MQPAKRILDFVAHTHPDATLDVVEFPSGAVSIDIRLRDLVVTVQHSPTHGFGISRLDDDSLGFNAHDRVFTDTDEAIAYLKDLFALDVGSEIEPK